MDPKDPQCSIDSDDIGFESDETYPEDAVYWLVGFCMLGLVLTFVVCELIG